MQFCREEIDNEITTFGRIEMKVHVTDIDDSNMTV